LQGLDPEKTAAKIRGQDPRPRSAAGGPPGSGHTDGPARIDPRFSPYSWDWAFIDPQQYVAGKRGHLCRPGIFEQLLDGTIPGPRNPIRGRPVGSRNAPPRWTLDQSFSADTSVSRPKLRGRPEPKPLCSSKRGEPAEPGRRGTTIFAQV
jgi:hypothetical protein